ncbi:PREDICTED: uncharacterized protein LOC109345881 isoform X2 [Lupinus angustifolius]|uniref:uncharacterized protein LOC109345881 isoform X2 n=1 Tax=Lupinus angustifolius TaxID=3871 RepID=UPI00092EC3BE|nr:PREDICTED: uncharacterized protein LOC109345881 isoform X2 [Lupinus angustifolius]
METTLCLKCGIYGISPSIPITTSRAMVSALGCSASSSDKRSLFSRFSFRYPLKSLCPKRICSGGYDGFSIDDTVSEDKMDIIEVEGKGQNGNWVFNICHANSVWRNNGNEKDEKDEDDEEEEYNGCRIEYDDDENGEEVIFDRDSFSKMLKRVSLSEVRLYEKMSHLGNLAYSIPNIKPGYLLKHYGLRFVTSSIEKKKLAATAEQNQASTATYEEESTEKDEGEGKEPKNCGYKISASAAYEIAAAAASYLHAQTRSILPFKSSNDEIGEGSPEASNESVDDANKNKAQVASWKATSGSVTAVVAAKEEVKQAFADDMNSTSSSPCEWYICDDDRSCTRYFIIQGSESFASWQANLLFEPIQFEGFDVLVHRGIYEAAKGIYQQMLPEIHAHLKSKGSKARFRFTGHSLGGSLALLVNLMLLIRKEVPIISLLPVITFGAPSIMCGGDSLLEKLGLPRNHVQAITMHRDIVPRAFSCNYPKHVAELLKAVNSNFRNHPCLNKQKLLYAPMGEFLILQPDENFSPSHDLLPSGSGLYLLSGPLSESNDTDMHLRAAQLVFLNSPHPLEILSDRSAYGSAGTIMRDHDMNSYLKSVRTVIRHELNQIRKASREQRRKAWWPIARPRGSGTSNVVGRSLLSSVNVIQDQPPFSGIIQTGRESLKWFGRLVGSNHMHLFVVFLLPARLLLLEAYSFISLR